MADGGGQAGQRGVHPLLHHCPGQAQVLRRSIGRVARRRRGGQPVPGEQDDGDLAPQHGDQAAVDQPQRGRRAGQHMDVLQDHRATTEQPAQFLAESAVDRLPAAHRARMPPHEREDALTEARIDPAGGLDEQQRQGRGVAVLWAQASPQQFAGARAERGDQPLRQQVAGRRLQDDRSATGRRRELVAFVLGTAARRRHDLRCESHSPPWPG